MKKHNQVVIRQVALGRFAGPVLCLLTLVLMLTSFFLGPAVTGAAAANPVLRVADVTAAPGSLVSIPIHMTSTGDVAGVEFDLNFNGDVLTYVDISEGVLTRNFLVQGAQKGGNIKVLVFSLNGAMIPIGSDSIAQISFRAANGIASGSKNDLKADHVKLVDVQGEAMGSWHEDGQWQVANQTVSADRTWLVRFNRPVDEDFLTSTITVADQNGRLQKVGVSRADEQTLAVAPPDGGYQKGTYFLLVSTGLRSQSGSNLKNPVVWQFTVQ